MKVIAIGFNDRGKQTQKQTLHAKNLKTAAKMVEVRHVNHVALIGESCSARVYEVNGKNRYVMSKPSIYKTFTAGKPSVMLLFEDNKRGLGEIYPFESAHERNEAYEKWSSKISEYAESAGAQEPQTDTTASTGATNGSGNSSTSRKTSNGSVENAIWKDEPILMSTAESSGEGSARNSGGIIWRNGSKNFLSKLGLKNSPSVYHNKPWFWVTYLGKKVLSVKQFTPGKYVTETGTVVSAKNCTTTPIELYVKPGAEIRVKDIFYAEDMKKLAGKKLLFITKNNSYYGAGFWWHPSWLTPEPPKKEKKDVKTVEKRGTKDSKTTRR